MGPSGDANSTKGAVHTGLVGPEDGVTDLAWENSGRQGYQERRKKRMFQAERTAETKAWRKDGDQKAD